MQKYYFLICFSLVNLTAVATLRDPPTCKEIKFADIGWTDVTATTAVASLLLERLGYAAQIMFLSLPVTLKSLSNGDVDIFLGNWMPSQKNDLKPYAESKSIENLGVNLKGAKFTLAVTKAAFNGGVRTFSDLSKHEDKFHKKIYGIEPGNEGNGYLLRIIKNNEFNLGTWRLIESSEQGMLAEVAHAVKENDWLVFLGWSPHPMNIQYPIHYLTGGDEYFGANLGEAEIYTLARNNFQTDCPNAAKFFQQLRLDKAFLEAIMDNILTNNMSPKKAAQVALDQNPKKAKQWLSGLSSFKERALLLEKSTRDSVRLGNFVAVFIENMTKRFSPMLRHLSNVIEGGIGEILRLISLSSPWAIILLLTLVAFLLRRSLMYPVFTMIGFVIIYFLGYFEAMLQTLVMTIMSTFVCVIIGIPLGIICARHRMVNRIISPILDMMQTVPTFVYLLPTLMLFGLGMVPGLISTIVFALAAPIKFTCLGILQVPKAQSEAAASLGATSFQSLRLIEIPLAMPTILAGVSQCVMLSLSMVVIAALVGAEGLGEPVVRALNTVDISMGFESGIVILILALILGHAFPKKIEEIDKNAN